MGVVIVCSALLSAMLATSVGHEFEDKFLVHRDGTWNHHPRVLHLGDERTAPATILLFRAGGEFVEHHCWLIESGGRTIISGGDPHVVAIGNWRCEGSNLIVLRQRIKRTVQVSGDRDPLCEFRELIFSVSGNTLRGTAETKQHVAFEPMELDAADFESYVKEARGSTIFCDGA